MIAMLRRWHHLLGAMVAMVLVVVAATGAVLVYRDAIVRYSVAAQVPSGLSVSQRQQAHALDSIVARYSPDSIAYLKTPATGRPYWTLVDVDGRSRLLAADTLIELTAYPWVLASLDVARDLHTELMLHLAGETVLFLIGVALLFFCVSGLLMWWPSRRHFHAGRLLPRRLSRQQLLISHRQLGVLLAPLLLLSGATGSIMLWNKLGHALGSSDESHAVETICSAAPTLRPSQLFATAAAELPEGIITLVHLPACPEDVATFRVRLPGEWHPNGRIRIPIRAHTGEVESYSRGDPEAGLSQLVLKQLYPLHSGYGLNAWFGFAVFLAGLVAVWLGISGFTGWVQRKRRNAIRLRAG